MAICTGVGFGALRSAGRQRDSPYVCGGAAQHRRGKEIKEIDVVQQKETHSQKSTHVLAVNRAS